MSLLLYGFPDPCHCLIYYGELNFLAKKGFFVCFAWWVGFRVVSKWMKFYGFWFLWPQMMLELGIVSVFFFVG